VFWILLVILGIVTPLVISFVTMFMAEGSAEVLLMIAIICHTIGAFALKYSVLKVGIYRSVLPGVA
jgi:formate-dependent nitrite reductase membrane component NrfD